MVASAKLVIMTEQTRGYIYRILIAVGTLVASYGFLTADELALWIGVATAALNIMPTANTSVKGDE